jgi:hypothetical protein
MVLRMRLLAVLLLAFLLAGCTQGTPDREDDFQASCPSWIKYPHNGQIIEGAMQWTNQSTNPNDLDRWDFMQWNATRGGQGLGDGLLEYEGHPLDQIVLNFHERQKSAGNPARRLGVQDGELHVRFWANEGGMPGQQLEAWDESLGRSSAKADWTFTSDPVKHYALFNITWHIDLAQPDEEPAPVGVFAEWELIPDQDRNPDTPSGAVMYYSPELWYRTCSSDGTKV